METSVYHIIMSMKNQYPKLKSPEFIGKKLLPPLSPHHKCDMSLTKRDIVLYLWNYRENDADFFSE